MVATSHPDSSYRVVLADDHEVTRAGLASMLRDLGTVEIVGEASDGREALQIVERLDPDLLFVDVEMPVMSGIEVARHLQEKGARVRIIALSAYDYREYVYGLLRNGALAYLKKGEANRENLGAAMHSVAELNEPWISPALAQRLVMRHAGRDTSDEPLSSLTQREIELLREVAHGRTNDDIAESVSISPYTVKNHIDHIRGKVGVSTRAELVAWAWHNRIVGGRQ